MLLSNINIYYYIEVKIIMYILLQYIKHNEKSQILLRSYKCKSMYDTWHMHVMH